MPKAKKAASPTPQEQFETLVKSYKNLPKDDPNACTAKNPNAPASGFQKAMLGKMGIGVTETTTMLDAHAAMKAFGDLNPEKHAEIFAARKAEIDAGKAAGKTKRPEEYCVPKEDAGKPATYTMMVQLNEAGIHKYSDASPVPTRGEVADKMNALRTSDKAKYDAVMTKTYEAVARWKHMAPQPNQVAFAQSVGVKVTPFTAAADGVAQKGSTAFSVGEKIHDVKVTEPEKYAEAKAAAAARHAAEKAVTAEKPDRAARVAAKAKTAVAEKQASDAARTGAVPTLTIPSSPSAQADGPQAGG